MSDLKLVLFYVVVLAVFVFGISNRSHYDDCVSPCVSMCDGLGCGFSCVFTHGGFLVG